MSRREVRVEQEEYPLPPPSKCAKVLYYTWKLCSVVFSHFVMISLVVAYCILGAVTFAKLEADHEIEVKKNISQIRSNTTLSIWTMTRTVPLFNQTNWTSEVVDMLKDFENAILLEMKVRGWDGNESDKDIQWTFTGALFYSIIVITTIETQREETQQQASATPVRNASTTHSQLTSTRRRRESRRYPESLQAGSSVRDRLFRSEERRLILEEQRNVEVAGIRMAVVELCGQMQQIKEQLQSRV